jgi:antitoxin (DNA-binding transcriptional repressor) of toxin-antitoxin stability system
MAETQRRIDLDDLPPRIAQALATLAEGEEVLLVQGGAVVARLTAGTAKPVVAPVEPASEADMAEILDHFASIIDDEF